MKKEKNWCSLTPPSITVVINPKRTLCVCASRRTWISNCEVKKTIWIGQVGSHLTIYFVSFVLILWWSVYGFYNENFYYLKLNDFDVCFSFTYKIIFFQIGYRILYIQSQKLCKNYAKANLSLFINHTSMTLTYHMSS